MVVEENFLKDTDCGINPENSYELQEKTKNLDERTVNLESGIQQSEKFSDYVIRKPAEVEKFLEKLNIYSNIAHSRPLFDGFMQNCGNETNNFVLLTPFYDFVPNKFNFSTYESNGKIGTPNQLVDRPSKPKLGFYVNDFLPKLKAELDKNDPLSSNQVDDLKQIAPRLQMQFESMANGDFKPPKLNGLEKYGRPRQILSGFEENAIIYPTCPNVIEESSKRQEFFLPWGEGESTKM